MHLFVLTLDHRTAPLALRERVSISDTVPGVAAESAVLATCNRIEVYGAAADPEAARAPLVDWLAGGSAALAAELSRHLRLLCGEAAVRHAFRVASGLESMVLGEPQILGQMKRAAAAAQAAGTLGERLHPLFQRAFAVAKEVRTRTRIGRGTVSHAAAAVELARSLFGSLSEARVLFVGAGAMIESAAPHFAAQRPRAIVVANRTTERAERVAGHVGGETLRLADVAGKLARFDIVVTCTSASAPMLTAAMVRDAQQARAGRPLLIVDLGVPRNVEPAAADVPGVSLHSVDDLGRRIEARLSLRGDAAERAEAIVEARLQAFMEWLAARQCVPLLRRLNDQAERVRAAEIERARRILAQGHPVEEALQSLAVGLSNKLLHPPRTALRGPAAPAQALALIEHWLGALEGSATRATRT